MIDPTALNWQSRTGGGSWIGTSEHCQNQHVRVEEFSGLPGYLELEALLGKEGFSAFRSQTVLHFNRNEYMTTSHGRVVATRHGSYSLQGSIRFLRKFATGSYIFHVYAKSPVVETINEAVASFKIPEGSGSLYIGPNPELKGEGVRKKARQLAIHGFGVTSGIAHLYNCIEVGYLTKGGRTNPDGKWASLEVTKEALERTLSTG